MGRIHHHAGETEHPSQRNSIIGYVRGVFSRKKAAAKIKTKENQNYSNDVVSPSDPNNIITKEEKGNTQDDDYSTNQPLAPPPSSSYHFSSSRSYSMGVAEASGGSKKKLRSSLSMKLSFRGKSKGDSLLSSMEKKEKKMQREGSLWKKPIILGDKCKVPDVDEDDDTITCDEKGNRISAYHKRTNHGSRQSSCIDPDSVQRAIAKT